MLNLISSVVTPFSKVSVTVAINPIVVWVCSTSGDAISGTSTVGFNLCGIARHSPLNSSVPAPQVIASPSATTTVTENDFCESFPASSMAVQVTVVVPTRYLLFCGKVQSTATFPSVSSTAVALKNWVAREPAVSTSNWVFSGTLITGGIMSTPGFTGWTLHSIWFTIPVSPFSNTPPIRFSILPVHISTSKVPQFWIKLLFFICPLTSIVVESNTAISFPEPSNSKLWPW